MSKKGIEIPNTIEYNLTPINHAQSYMKISEKYWFGFYRVPGAKANSRRGWSVEGRFFFFQVFP